MSGLRPLAFFGTLRLGVHGAKGKEAPKNRAGLSTSRQWTKVGGMPIKSVAAPDVTGRHPRGWLRRKQKIRGMMAGPRRRPAGGRNALHGREQGENGPPSAARQRPKFLITIDTEEDNAWARQAEQRTENAKALPRFQEFCEAFGLKPTYLTNHPMACSRAFRELGRDVLQRGTGEIGMHLHAWNNPPEYALTGNDARHHPYLMEYPEGVIRDKAAYLTDLLGETFGIRPVSHRAGRWGLNGPYARILAELEYETDCSVTPHVSWREHMGDPRGRGGSDYTAYPEHAYYLDLEDISCPGSSPLLEVPMTVVQCTNRLATSLRARFAPESLTGRAVNKFWPEVTWFRPNRCNLKQMKAILRRALRDGREYVEFMLHSSELMAGGSPKFPDEATIARLYDDMGELFSAASGSFEGATLAEYRKACPAP